MSGNDWYSAKEALECLGADEDNDKRWRISKRIVKNSRGGMIKTKASKIMKSGQPVSERVIPYYFWWKDMSPSVSQCWDDGNFSNLVFEPGAPDKGEEWECFGVQFKKKDVEGLEPEKISRKPKVSIDELKITFNQLEEIFLKMKNTQDEVWRVLNIIHRDSNVTQEQTRDLWSNSKLKDKNPGPPRESR